MSTPADDLTAKALNLLPEDRAKLVERLLASFEPRSAAQSAWLELAAGRRHEVRSGKVEMIAGEQVLARVRARSA
jgi:putative addiction module component (TIGR02574 family)